MADFVTTRTHVTEVPQIEVTFDSGKPLGPGTHSFRLKVTDDSGNESAPTEVKVVVVDDQHPTAVVDLVTERPGQSPGIGESFVLDGSGSVDIGGKIVKYEWTLLDR